MYEYEVDGFLFESKTQSEEAKKEAEGIHYIKEHTSLDNPEVVLKLYNRLISQKMFHTPVGINFLCELRLILLAFELKPEEIQPIPIPRSRTHDKHKAEPQQPKKNYKKQFYIAATLAVIFGISIAGMFFIMKISKNNVNIINYRNKIIDEYQDWEKELQEKEAFLKQLEELINQETSTQAEP